MSEPPSGLALAEQADRLFQPGDADRRWYVLHAKPRCEKKAAKTCLDAEIRHYLPLRQSRPRQRKGQRRYSFDVPLLPGYLFACCDGAERLALLSLARVASALARKADVALGDAGPEGSALARRVTGAALVRASHTPCVSCLAVLAQFRALLCEVALGVGLMDWRETCWGLLGDEAS